MDVAASEFHKYALFIYLISFVRVRTLPYALISFAKFCSKLVQNVCFFSAYYCFFTLGQLGLNQAKKPERGGGRNRTVVLPFLRRSWKTWLIFYCFISHHYVFPKERKVRSGFQEPEERPEHVLGAGEARRAVPGIHQGLPDRLHRRSVRSGSLGCLDFLHCQHEHSSTVLKLGTRR